MTKAEIESKLDSQLNMVAGEAGALKAVALAILHLSKTLELQRP